MPKTVHRKVLLSATLLAVAIGMFSRPVVGQEQILSVGLSGGISGSLDEDNSGFSNPTFQIRFTYETARHRNLAVRAGRMDFAGEQLSLALDATIDYVTVAGEYLFVEAGHESGFLLGLGYYDLGGIQLDGTSADEGSVGFVLGATGEFEVAPRWFVFVDALAHYAALDAAQIFGSLQVGFGYRF